MAEMDFRKFEVINGEGYEFHALDFGGDGVKIELYDPRDIDMLECQRIHAVILKPHNVRDLFMWIAKK